MKRISDRYILGKHHNSGDKKLFDILKNKNKGKEKQDYIPEIKRFMKGNDF